MNTSIQSIDLSLAKRALYQLPPDARQITCHTGALWITQDSDLRDTVLKPGESFTTDGRHTVIAYALDPASLSVQVAHTAPAPRRRLAGGHAARALALE